MKKKNHPTSQNLRDVTAMENVASPWWDRSVEIEEETCMGEHQRSEGEFVDEGSHNS